MPATRTTSGLFAEPLRLRRLQLHLTQAEVAQRAGLSSARVCDYEGGISDPSFSTLLRLAGAVRLHLGDLQPLVELAGEAKRRGRGEGAAPDGPSRRSGRRTRRKPR